MSSRNHRAYPHRNRPVLAGLIGVFAVVSAASADTLWIDYDTETDAGEFVYSVADRALINQTVRDLMGTLGIDVPDAMPASGPFSTVFVNAASAGTSDGVDFRNLEANDNASINATLALDSVGLTAAEMTSDKIIATTINLVMHEGLHMWGGRHHDAFFAIGDGVSTAGNAARFAPAYPGPQDAALTGSTFMSLTGVLGLSEAKFTSEHAPGDR